MARIGLQRLASRIRLVVSDALQNKLADPRLERIASVIRVEVSADLAYADVYISVMGSESQQRAYVAGLKHAHGHLQSLVARQLETRNCPSVRFHLDQSLKKGFETLRLIDKTMAELADREDPRGGGPCGEVGGATDGTDAGTLPEECE